MKRLVYTPKINAYVKADSGVYDLTDYITDFSVDRKVNQVSTAQLTLRNPDKKWTNYTYTNPTTGQKTVGPVFHPMDPITILLTRLRNRPVQVFTGFCDSTPYLQLFPGTVQITASCTLKKLLYTFFDPGLPFMVEYLSQYGWTPSPSGGIAKPSAEQAAAGQSPRFDDSGIGELLYHVLKDIGGWPDETIFIEEMPSQVIDLIANLFDLFKADAQESSKELTQLLHQIVGSAPMGSGSPGDSTGTGSGDWVKCGATWEKDVFNPANPHGGGMAFAELLVAGANANLKDQSISKVLGIPEDPNYPYGMPQGTPLQVRLPGGNKVFTMYKNDVGSGQLGDPHYKIDLQNGIKDALGWTPNGDIEVRKVVSTPDTKHHPQLG